MSTWLAKALEEWNKTPVEIFKRSVTHASWKDTLSFHGETFHRECGGCSGRFEFLPNEAIFLKWDRWTPEILHSSDKILSLEDYARLRESDPLILRSSWAVPASPHAAICIVTFSRGRLSHLCSLIACMKAQKRKNFIHVVHATGYTGVQHRFLNQMIGEDPRFILRETLAMSQKAHFKHILADARRINPPYIVKIDDDDVYSPSFLDVILNAASECDFAASVSLMVHNSMDNCSVLLQESSQFGNNMCISRRAVEHLLRCSDNGHLYEDAFAHHALLDAGFDVRTFSLDFPIILYVRHGRNVTA